MKESNDKGKSEDFRLVDLQGRRREELRKEERIRTFRHYLDWTIYRDAILRRLRVIWGYRGILGRTKTVVVAGGAIFILTLLLGLAGSSGLALLPALLGFGLSLAGLIYGATPQLSSRIERLPRHGVIAAWAFLTTLCAFVGFSSTAVIILVLFVGGFTAVNVLWSFLPRLLALLDRGQKGAKGYAQATASPTPLLLALTVIATWSMVASFLMGFLRIHETRPLGTAFLFAHVGLLLGLVPLEGQLLQSLRRHTMARWYLLRPRRLLRDVLFTAMVAALIGYEVSIASEGGTFSGIPAFALALVLFSYLGVLLRHVSALGERLKPAHPLILPSFGMLLLFAPLVVILSNPPLTVTRIYGGAQTAGLAAGVAFILVHALWREWTDRLRARLRETVKKRVPIESSEKESDTYQRIGAGRMRRGSPGVQIREAESRGEEENGSPP